MVNRLVSVGDDFTLPDAVLVDDVNLPAHAKAAALANKADKSGLPISAKDYGAVGNGVANDTTALQNAINAAIAAKKALYIPGGTYKTTAALVIPDHLTVWGAGCGEAWNSVKTTDPNDYSSYYTYTDLVSGTIILPSTAGQDGIQITGRGKNVTLRDFGIRFADAIKYTNTGHGFNVIPPTNPTDVTSPDHGLFGAVWDNLKVFGHDGNHYGFRISNMLGCHFSNLNSAGGGGLSMTSDGNLFFYGNSVVTGFYGAVIQGGTAHGIYLGGSGGGQGGHIQLLQFMRPQTWVANAVNNMPGTTAPTNAQYNLYSDMARTRRMAWYGPDFESNVAAYVQFPTESNTVTDSSQTAPTAWSPAYIAARSPKTTGISNNTSYQNATAKDVLYTCNFLHNPDATTASSLTIRVSPDAAFASGQKQTVVLSTRPAGSAAGVPEVCTFVIPGNWYFQINATRMSWASDTLWKFVSLSGY